MIKPTLSNEEKLERLEKRQKNLNSRMAKLKREEKKVLEKINQERITTLFQFEARMKEVFGEELFDELISFTHDDFVKPYQYSNGSEQSLADLWKEDILNIYNAKFQKREMNIQSETITKIEIENQVIEIPKEKLRSSQKTKKAIRLGLKKGIDISHYANLKFNGQQMIQIRLGLEQGIDVSLYAKPEFDRYQMEEIRQGLENKLDVSLYAKPEFNWTQMKSIRDKLKEECSLDFV